MKKLISTVLAVALNSLALIAPRRAAKLSFQLFCHPFRLKISEKQHAFFNTANKSVLEHDGNRVQVYAWGEGPQKVLFLHGWQSHSYIWKSYVEQFDRRKYTLYAIDAPGHGLSSGSFLSVPLYAVLVEKFLQKSGKMDFIVGHSLGCFTTFFLLHHKPEWMPKRLAILGSPGEAAEFFDFYQEALGLSKRVMELTRRRFIELFGETPEFFSAPKFAANLPAEGLIIHDEGDLETSVDNARKIHKVWPSSKLHLTQGLGHNLKSKDIVKLVLEFVDQKQHEKVEI